MTLSGTDRRMCAEIASTRSRFSDEAAGHILSAGVALSRRSRGAISELASSTAPNLSVAPGTSKDIMLLP
jgi:hypothetical protein